jgi:hypothetical protein
VVAIGRASGGTPDTPEFSAQPKMRPNEVLPESHIFVNSLLEKHYTDILNRLLILCKWKHYKRLFQNFIWAHFLPRKKSGFAGLHALTFQPRQRRD